MKEYIKNNKNILKTTILAILCIIFITISYKNSIPFGNPLYVINKLPKYVFLYSIFITIIIQLIVIIRYNEVKSKIYVMLSVVFANLVSFLLPYSVAKLGYSNNIIKHIANFYQTLLMDQQKWFYLLILSLIIQMIITFVLLLFDIKDKKRLAITILISNFLQVLLNLIKII